MASYIARSVLAGFILEVARMHQSDIRSVTLDFSPLTTAGTNWHVASIDPGDVETAFAHAIVARAASGNRGWVMVEDGSPLDGQVVGSEHA